MRLLFTHFPPAMSALVILAALTGCTVPSKHRSAVDAPRTVCNSSEDVKHLSAVRYGRYTLVELRPEPGQLDLSQQVVDAAIPAQLSATVGDGVQHLLQRTGYSLCHTDETAALYALPLPAAHLRLGPQKLRNALQTLAGPAWRLTLNQGSREVCFVRAQEAIEPFQIGVAP
ncbi:PilL N-terminal domain-containing protein [Pseudomonas chlororaphis]|uniref:PFGI-1 class ICE element type IV pilus protein PilL2 n=1 Tax=Pseudomonas chlororaphis TaxID=587753 RepID=UPI0009B8A075|nr:PilL N-terminal domain-containing protein [Pseudomonas chlororaphis]